MHPLVEAELRGASAIDPDVPFRARTNHTHATWARTFSSLPELYIQPESTAEILKAIALARRCRRRIVVTGCAHSPSSITCTSAWMLNLDRFADVLAVDRPSGTVVMQAGIRLFALCERLEREGLAMPNLGSINEQSIAGAIATGTHGSSLRHGLMSEDVLALKVALADGSEVRCARDQRPELFRAASLSLGALGVVTEVTFRAVPAYTLRWAQTVDADAKLFAAWHRDDLWTAHEFVRVWWFPYTRRAVVWHADQTDEPPRAPPRSGYDSRLGYYLYHNLLYLAQFAPRILPLVEWLVFGLQYGFRNGARAEAVQPSREALLMNCLYPQFVNEWAIPLHRGPEALRRLGAWLNRLPPSDPAYVPHGIPFSADGLYVHAPVEVRVSDTTLHTTNPASPSSASPSTSSEARNPRPFLDPTVPDGPTLYLNATLYRPYFRDPPCRARYYQAFEWLMRDMGGRPHWAKNFESRRPDIEDLYGQDLQDFRRVRDDADPLGMFIGPWHRERILADGSVYELEEREAFREQTARGVTVHGAMEK
ncbi:putative D-arabinono-1 [Escovopsis weberi]|uniref:D-arabinono-1,4-lactone oxidase n=1 Tax=Escovopsis weberi TaxID=150374 RepID=A0A0M9VVD8_ESCWE|nr:putative D-arabinono-1 [Escovopsis weberi]